MKGYIGLAIGILLAVIVLLVNHFYYGIRFDSDSAGVLISALSVMVTALVGWQVYNAVEMRKMIDGVEKLKQELLRLGKEHKEKSISLEWLASALHGGLLPRNKFTNDVEYFLHCMDVVGCFIKSGAKLDSAPFIRSIELLEKTLEGIQKRNNKDEILFMGGNKDFVREWYQEANRIIDTEVHHLKGIKNRINKVYDDYIVLTKDVRIIPQNPSHKSTNSKSDKKGKKK